ncbi:hypothetical protein [Streptomyces sp. SAI-229]|uniref:hypothetical protein n=1 Tax=Streptomyces sp. SAI-229 TaxID=3377731 RepID=UPI003C7AB936
MVALLLPLSQAGGWGWGSARVLGLLGAAVVLFALWLYAESRFRSPLIDLRVMRLPAVWTTNTAALLFGAGMYAIWSFLPGFVQTPDSAGYGFGASVTTAGLLMLPMLVAMFLSGMLSGRLEPVVGAKSLPSPRACRRSPAAPRASPCSPCSASRRRARPSWSRPAAPPASVQPAIPEPKPGAPAVRG